MGTLAHQVRVAHSRLALGRCEGGSREGGKGPVGPGWCSPQPCSLKLGCHYLRPLHCGPHDDHDSPQPVGSTGATGSGVVQGHAAIGLQIVHPAVDKRPWTGGVHDTTEGSKPQHGPFVELGSLMVKTV